MTEILHLARLRLVKVDFHFGEGVGPPYFEKWASKEAISTCWRYLGYSGQVVVQSRR